MSNTAGMVYEATPTNKKPSKVAVKKAHRVGLNDYSLLYLQGYILWQVKHQIVYTFAGLVVLNWLFPFLLPMAIDGLQSIVR